MVPWSWISNVEFLSKSVQKIQVSKNGPKDFQLFKSFRQKQFDFFWFSMVSHTAPVLPYIIDWSQHKPTQIKKLEKNETLFLFGK